MAIEETSSSTSTSTQYEVNQTAKSRDVDVLLLEHDSDQEPILSVVIPTLNEEDGVGPVIEMVKNAARDLQVGTEIIISDSSTDRTPEIAEEMGAIVVTPDQPGYGYAYRYAFEYARGDYIVIGDADCTYDFEDIPKLLDLVANGDADMAMGSRLEGEILPGSMPRLHQYVGNPLLTKFLNVFYKAGVSDAHSGFRVFRAEMLEELNLKTDGMEFASEMIMEAGAKGLTIEEVPITYHPREGEANLESFSDGWRHVKFMLVNAPGYLFSIPGMALAGMGVLTMLVSFLDISIGGISLGAHSMIAGSLMAIVGYQVLSLAAFSSLASNPIKESRDPITRWLRGGFNMERVATAGAVVAGSGMAYAAYLGYTWIASGFTELPIVPADVIAFTAIVLGIQTLFQAFFLSTFVEQSN